MGVVRSNRTRGEKVNSTLVFRVNELLSCVCLQQLLPEDAVPLGGMRGVTSEQTNIKKVAVKQDQSSIEKLFYLQLY